MPIPVPDFVALKNARWGEAFVLLLEIEYADGQFVRWARLGSTETSISFEGHTWDATVLIGNPRRSQNSRAEIPTFDIPLSNPERVFQSVLQNYIVEGRSGRLITVHRDHLDDPTAKIEEWFTIETASSNAKVINLTCRGVRHNPRSCRIPSQTMSRREYPALRGANSRFHL